MTLAAEFIGLTLTELAVALAAGGYLIERFLDAKGWSRSAKTLRRENEDLLRRNNELDRVVGRHEATIREQAAAIAQLERQVKDLQQLDQTAVLKQLEINAAKSETRHAEALVLWTQIRDKLVPTSEGG